MERLVLVRKSTGDILDRNATYPRADLNEPVVGMDPDLEYLIYHEPYAAPTYDSRIYLLQTTEEVSEDPHPVYANLNQFKITFDTVKRDTTEIETAIKGREVTANNNLVPQEKFNKLVILGLGVIFRNFEGQTLNSKEVIIKNKVIQAAVKVWKNDAAVRTKIQELADGLEPAIDDGWDEDDVVDPIETTE